MIYARVVRVERALEAHCAAQRFTPPEQGPDVAAAVCASTLARIDPPVLGGATAQAWAQTTSEERARGEFDLRGQARVHGAARKNEAKKPIGLRACAEWPV